MMQNTEEGMRLLKNAIIARNSIKSYGDPELFVSDGRFVGLDYDYDISDETICKFFSEHCLGANIEIKQRKSFICHSLL